MVTAEVVRRGYAQVMTIPPNVRHQELFVKLQREAREQKRGLWAEASMAESVPAPVVPQRQSPEDGQAWLPRLRGRGPANYPMSGTGRRGEQDGDEDAGGDGESPRFMLG